jgi:signal transduction histidine kinase
VDEIRKLTHNIDTSHLADMGLAESLKVLIGDINVLHVIDIKLNHRRYYYSASGCFNRIQNNTGTVK